MGPDTRICLPSRFGHRRSDITILTFLRSNSTLDIKHKSLAVLYSMNFFVLSGKKLPKNLKLSFTLQSETPEKHSVPQNRVHAYKLNKSNSRTN